MLLLYLYSNCKNFWLVQYKHSTKPLARWLFPKPYITLLKLLKHGSFFSFQIQWNHYFKGDDSMTNEEVYVRAYEEIKLRGLPLP